MASRRHRPARVTVLRTPVIRTVLGWVAAAMLRVFRWTTVVRIPDGPKAVLVIAPHTSYWDFPILIGAALKHRVDAHWLGTHRLFRGPGGPLFRWLGGIPVDRTRRNGLVESVVEAFGTHERLFVAVAPEGTRYRRDGWKSGFHRMARGAGVPLWLAGIDYAAKTVRADAVVAPSGDIEADLRRVATFYAPMQGKHPERFTPPADEAGAS